MVAMNFDITATSADAEKSFEKLADDADRFGVALTDLDGKVVKPKVDLDISGAERDADSISAKLDGIGDVTARVSLTGATEAWSDADELSEALDRITDRTATVRLAGADGARDDARDLADALDRITDRTATVRLDMAGDTGALATAFADAEALEALSPIRLDVDVDPGDIAKTRLNDLFVQAAALGALTPTIRLDLDGGAALSGQLAALLAQLATLTTGTHNVRVQMAQTSFLGQMAQIRRELNSIAGHKIEITAEVEGLMVSTALARQELARLEAMDPSVRVEADVTSARAAVQELEEELARVAARQHRAKVTVDFDQSVVGRLAQLSTGLMKVSAGGGAAAVGLGQTVGAVGALVSALGPLSGLTGVAAGGLGVLAAANVTVKAGLLGMAAAVKVVHDQDPEALAESMRGMAPAGRDFASAYAGVSAEFGKARLDVQQRLFAGLGTEVTQLGQTALPMLRDRMGGVSDALNVGAKDFAGYLQSAEATSRVGAIFNNTERAIRNTSPAATDLTAILLDVGSVGSAVFADMTEGLGVTTAGWRNMIAEARATGQLRDWMDQAVVTVRTLGDVAGNVGGTVGGIFRAGQEEHVDFLARMQQGTQAVEDFVNSAEGQTALRAFFDETQGAVDELMPGLGNLGAAAGEAVSRFGETDGLIRFGSAGREVLDTTSELVPALGTLGGETLGVLSDAAGNVATGLAPVASLLGDVLDAAGPVAPAVTAMVVAFVGARVVQGIVAGIGTSMAAGAVSAGVYTERMLGSAAAGSAVMTAGGGVATAVGKVASALPLAAVAVVGLSMAYEAFATNSDELAKSVADGSMSMSAAITSAAAQIDANGIDWLGGADEAEAYRLATEEVTRETESYIATLPQMEQLEARVAIARTKLNDETLKHGPASQQARDAALQLQAALTDQETAQDKLKLATSGSTEALLEQQRVQLGAVDADIAYLDSLDRVAEAQDRAKAAADDHTLSQREQEAAARDVLRANLDAAAAAGEKARADAVATGAANADEVAARAQKDELIRLANQASGPTRQALLDAANGTDLLARAQGTAEIQARLQKDELGRLAGQAQGPLAQAIATARDNFGQLGGAHATAETRAMLQKNELQRLAGMASGPLRTELQRMADQIRTLPSGNFNVTATGISKFTFKPNGTVVGQPQIASGGIWLGPGRAHNSRQAFASGGNFGMLPGYSPGHDTHRFISPTGGVLDLAGGEPVMRQEFGQAVGREFIDQANYVARSGGTGAVRRLLHSTFSQPGRTEEGLHLGGHVPYQAHAMGGLIRNGRQPFTVIPPEQHVTTAEDVRQRLGAQMQRYIQEHERKAQAALNAQASAALGGGSGQGWQWQMNVLRQRFPGLPLNSGFRPGAITATGNRSYHSMGRAVDVPPRMDVFNWIKGTYGANTKELIFSPANGAQVHNGRPHMYTGVTRSNHFDHVHWAMRNGGVFGSRKAIRGRLADRGGTFEHGEAAVNLSGRAERALTGRQDDNLMRMTAAIERVRTVSTPAGGGVGAVVTAGGATAPQIRVDVPLDELRADLRALLDGVRSAAQLAHEDAGGAAAAVRASMQQVAASLRGSVATQQQSLRTSAELGRI